MDVSGSGREGRPMLCIREDRMNVSALSFYKLRCVITKGYGDLCKIREICDKNLLDHR
jgi:hypothetical protein